MGSSSNRNNKQNMAFINRFIVIYIILYFNLNYSDHINSVHKWDMKGLSENPNLTIDFIIRNHTENW
jgi:hypothetical protein